MCSSDLVVCVNGDVVRTMLKTVPKEALNDMYPACNSLYAAKISPRPILFLNGKRDNIVPHAATMLTYDAIGDNKEIVWYDSGHGLPSEAVEKATTWLKEKSKKK